MTGAILLDTHILLWLENGDSKLRPSTRGMIEEHWRSGGTVLVSAVSAWEIAMLMDGGRIRLEYSAEEWMQRCLGRPGFKEVPLSWRTGIEAYKLRHFEHRDPADRLLTATAIELACVFVTYDARISRFAARWGKQYGLQLVS